MKILFINGARAGESLTLTDAAVTVGREEGNILRLDSEGVSRFHGQIRRDNGVYLVDDLGSTNGIKINGTPVRLSAVLKEGDMVEFGSQKLRISDLDSAGTDTSGTVLAAELKKGAVKLFDDVSGSSGRSAAESRGFSRRFILYLTCAILLAVAFFMFMTSLDRRKSSSAGRAIPAEDFMLFYEKEQRSAENVFRFVLHIENRRAVFTVDDLSSGRHFQRVFEQVTPEALEPLASRVARSGFFAMEQPQKGDSDGIRHERRRLVVGTSGKLKDVEVVNNYIPDQFKELEAAVELFADNYNLQTISMTPQELMSQAESCFLKAEELFANRAARLVNLRDAILRYKITLDCLEQFSPRPAIWEKAVKQLKIAEKLREQKYQELDFEQKRLLRFKDFQALRSVYARQMELCDPDSPEYSLARERIFLLDRHFQKAKKRR